MDQVLIRVKTLKDKEVHCIDKDIRDCNTETRETFYHSQSKGQIMALLELYVKDQFGQM